jgi:hypothetical protein
MQSQARSNEHATTSEAHPSGVSQGLSWAARLGRHVGHRALREGAGRSHVQAGVRVPPVVGVADHGAEGTGEPLAVVLWPGNAGSNTQPTTSR